ncbi:MAG: TolB-like 6-bladed beta-propeller domain-containing protein [Tannerellaceae bacterium]|nr:TolB-like 6-bladed beta-propeller domain-containing protein [Tannerellaceae bacterium]
MKKLLILSFCITMIYSCRYSTEYKDADVFSWEAFGDPVEVILQPAGIQDIPLMARKMVVHDSLLIAYSMGTENLIYTYNLNTGEKLNESISYGSGPGEMIGISAFQKRDSFLFISCIQIQSISFIPFSYFTTDNPSAEDISRFYLEDDADGLTPLSIDQIVGLALLPEKKRFNFYTGEGKLIHSYGEYPDFGETLTELEQIHGFISNLCFNSRTSRFYSFCKTSDLIEVFDTSGNLLKRLHGPDHFFPKVKQQSLGGDLVRASIKDSQDAYFEPYIIGDEVMVIYSGTSALESTNRLLVFDDFGNPVKYFLLDENILTFAADERTKTIYVVTFEGMEIKKFAYE